LRIGRDKELSLEVVADGFDDDFLTVLGELLSDLLEKGREEEVSKHLNNDLPPEQVPDLSLLTVTNLIVVLGNILKDLITLEGPLLNSRLFPRQSQLNIDELLLLCLFCQNPKLLGQSLNRFVSDLFYWEVL
jgi:hypothetical protein